MCDFISFFHRPDTGDIVVSDLMSHSDTQKKLSLSDKLWREGHYWPDGTLELRVSESDRTTQQDCEDRFRNRFPKFSDFFNWVLGEVCQNGVYPVSLDLISLTTLDPGVVLPKKITGSIYMISLTTLDPGVVLPKKITGSIYMRSLTTLDPGVAKKFRKICDYIYR